MRGYKIKTLCALGFKIIGLTVGHAQTSSFFLLLVLAKKKRDLRLQRRSKNVSLRDIKNAS